MEMTTTITVVEYDDGSVRTVHDNHKRQQKYFNNNNSFVESHEK